MNGRKENGYKYEIYIYAFTLNAPPGQNNSNRNCIAITSMHIANTHTKTYGSCFVVGWQTLYSLLFARFMACIVPCAFKNYGAEKKQSKNRTQFPFGLTDDCKLQCDLEHAYKLPSTFAPLRIRMRSSLAIALC